MSSEFRHGVGRIFTYCNSVAFAALLKGLPPVGYLALAVLLVAPCHAEAAAVTGRVATRVRAGTPPAPAVVFAEPLGAAPPRRPGSFVMTQKNKTFTPRVLAIPVGSTVRFPNEDAIFHNVFSLSTPAPFDLGLYRAGASKSRTFERPAVYRVFCNIHPQMSALIVVAPSPWVSEVGSDGSYRLELPPGRYRVTAVSERAAPASAEIDVGSAPATAAELVLDESNAPTTHTNKFGKPYPKDAYKQ